TWSCAARANCWARSRPAWPRSASPTWPATPTCCRWCSASARSCSGMRRTSPTARWSAGSAALPATPRPEPAFARDRRVRQLRAEQGKTQMTERIPLLIDTDPGVDDALALLMAFADTRHDVVGLTIAAGNVGLRHTVANALKLCEVAGRADIP